MFFERARSGEEVKPDARALLAPSARQMQKAKARQKGAIATIEERKRETATTTTRIERTTRAILSSHGDSYN